MSKASSLLLELVNITFEVLAPEDERVDWTGLFCTNSEKNELHSAPDKTAKNLWESMPPRNLRSFHNVRIRSFKLAETTEVVAAFDEHTLTQ